MLLSSLLCAGTMLVSGDRMLTNILSSKELKSRE